MKNNILKIFSILVAVVVLSGSSLSAAPVNIESNKDTNIDITKVYETRFLNMLEHNFVYDDDIKYVENIVNNSILALLNLRDKNLQDYISENYVREYIFNMYGIEIEDFSNINSDFPKMAGYVYIIPRGYWEYEHKPLSLTQNEDGSFTFKTEILQIAHDDQETASTCTTLFVINEASDFGFNIINCVIN